MRNKIKPFVVEVKKSKRAKALGTGTAEAGSFDRPRLNWPDLAALQAEPQPASVAIEAFLPPPAQEHAQAEDPVVPAPAARILWVDGFEDPVEVMMREAGEKRGKRGPRPGSSPVRTPAPAPRREPEAVSAAASPAGLASMVAPVLPASIEALIAAVPIEAARRGQRLREKRLPRGERWKQRRLPRYCH